MFRAISVNMRPDTSLTLSVTLRVTGGGGAGRLTGAPRVGLVHLSHAGYSAHGSCRCGPSGKLTQSAPASSGTFSCCAALLKIGTAR